MVDSTEVKFRDLLRRKSDGWLTPIRPRFANDPDYEAVRVEIPSLRVISVQPASKKAPAIDTGKKPVPNKQAGTAKARRRSPKRKAQPKATSAPAADLGEIGELLDDLGNYENSTGCDN